MDADKITISACSHKRYFVVRPAKRDVLCHGNANAATLGLYYHAAAFDFAPQMVVQYDTRKEAEIHRKRWIAQLRAAHIGRKHWTGWVVLCGTIAVVLDKPRGKK